MIAERVNEASVHVVLRAWNTGNRSATFAKPGVTIVGLIPNMRTANADAYVRPVILTSQ